MTKVQNYQTIFLIVKKLLISLTSDTFFDWLRKNLNGDVIASTSYIVILQKWVPLAFI